MSYLAPFQTYYRFSAEKSDPFTRYINVFTDAIVVKGVSRAFSGPVYTYVCMYVCTYIGTLKQQESRAVARKPRDAAAVLLGLKFADDIHYKFKSSQVSKARIQSSIHIGTKRNLT